MSQVNKSSINDIPTNMIRRPNVGAMLCHRLLRWPSIAPTGEVEGEVEGINT